MNDKGSSGSFEAKENLPLIITNGKIYGTLVKEKIEDSEKREYNLDDKFNLTYLKYAKIAGIGNADDPLLSYHKRQSIIWNLLRYQGDDYLFIIREWNQLASFEMGNVKEIYYVCLLHQRTINAGECFEQIKQKSNPNNELQQADNTDAHQSDNNNNNNNNNTEEKRNNNQENKSGSPCNVAFFLACQSLDKETRRCEAKEFSTPEIDPYLDIIMGKAEKSEPAKFAVLHYKHFHETVLVSQLNCLDYCIYYAFYKTHGNFCLALFSLLFTFAFSLAALVVSIDALNQKK